jgi:hypothetical protein
LKSQDRFRLWSLDEVMAKVQAYELKGLRKATSAYEQNPSLYFAKSTENKTSTAGVAFLSIEIRFDDSVEKEFGLLW